MPVTLDPFFDLTGNSNWNALIGRQGNAANYADGYIEAALDLANLIIKEDRFGQRDTLVLPILYNARHSIELHLKLIIGVFVDVEILKSGHVPNHDIASHFQLLFESNIPDLTFRCLLKDLQTFVISLAKVDDDGQELRYSTNRDGQRSLDDRTLVNIVVIRDSLITLKDVLERFKYRAFELCDELPTGTQTNCLSRKDVFALARMLPKRDRWSEPTFEECRSAVKEHFSIGSRQLSIALDLIKERRELKAIIGVETSLTHLSDETALFLAEQWRVINPKREHSELMADTFTRDFTDILGSHQLENDAMKAILRELSSDEIADAETIFYLARNRDYSEMYEVELDRKKKEYRASGDIGVEAHNLMYKTNFLSDFTRGVAMLGRLELSEKLKGI